MKAKFGTPVPIAWSLFGKETEAHLFRPPEVEYIDPDGYSAVGFRVVLNPGNIHCITASSPELAQRVADLLNRDGWNAKKAKLQATTPSGASSD